MQLSEWILKNVFSPDMDSQILSPHSLVHPLQLRPEISPFNIKIQHSGVIDQNWKWSIGQMSGRLTKDLVQHGAMRLSEAKEFFGV